MTTPHPSHQCPACHADRLTGHPASLAFDHQPGCPLGASERDLERVDRADLARTRGRRLVRTITSDEADLLLTCGVEVVRSAVEVEVVDGHRVRTFRDPLDDERIDLDDLAADVVPADQWRSQ